MSGQNPVLIPGPTNLPEEIRKACCVPTIDHRSPVFGRISNPCLDGVRTGCSRIIAPDFAMWMPHALGPLIESGILLASIAAGRAVEEDVEPDRGDAEQEARATVMASEGGH